MTSVSSSRDRNLEEILDPTLTQVADHYYQREFAQPN